MLDKINLIGNYIRFMGNKKNFHGSAVHAIKKDQYIKSEDAIQKENKNISNAITFLSGINFETFLEQLIEKNNWNNGSDIVSFNYSQDDIENIQIDVYNFEEGQNIDFTLSKKDFIQVLEKIKDNVLKQNPENKDKIQELHNQLIKILTKE